MAKRRAKSCDKLGEHGICLAIVVVLEKITYCPAGRAESCSPGACCHHPLFRIKPLLREMGEAGIELRRYGAKLRDPDFVDRLYQEFVKARRRRSKSR